MKCQRCNAAAVLHITEVGGPGLAGEEHHLCEPCATAQLYEGQGPQPPWATRLRGTPPERRDRGARFEVVRLIISEVHEQQVVTLGEVGGSRTLSISIGIFEATSLDRRLKRLPAPRPLSFDAWAATIAALGGRLQDVFLTELRDYIYYAQLRIRPADAGQPTGTGVTNEPSQSWPSSRAPGLVEVDLRPSDAFNLAILLAAPIFINDTVLAAALGG
jgi:bifunctional DNase/RNase